MRRFLYLAALLPLPIAVVLAPDMNPHAGAFALLLGAVLCLPGFLSGDATRPRAAVMVPAVLVALYFAWRMVASPVGDFAFRDGLMLAGGLLGLLVGSAGLERFAKMMAVGAVLVAVVSVGVACWQKWVNPEMELFYGFRPGGVSARPSGFSGHYNHFANFVGAGAALALGWVVVPGCLRLRVAAGVVSAVLAWGVFLSQSRGGFFALVAGLALVAALGIIWGAKKERVVLRIAGAIAVVVVLSATILMGDRILALALPERVDRDGGVYSLHEARFEYFQVGYALALQAPLLGSGSRSFSYRSLEFWDPSELNIVSADIEFVHNEAIQVACDYGLIGVGLLVVLLLAVTIVAIASGSIHRGRRSNAWRFGALGGAVVMLVQSQFSFVFHMLPDTLFFGLLLGMASRRFGDDGASAPASNYGRVLGGIVCLASIVLAGRHTVGWWHLYGPGSSERSQEARFGKAVQVSPDYLLWFNLASGKVAEANEPGARREAKLEEAEACLSRALERHPYHYISIVSRARMLDELDRFDEAEEDFKRVVPLLDPREWYYHSRMLLARHYFRKAEQRWMRKGYASGMERDAPLALALFEEAVFHAELSRRQNSPERSEAEEIIAAAKQRIDFLRGAHVEPKPIPRIGGEVEMP